MRIIDKRKDYYDCVQAQGIDKQCIYIRKEEDIWIDRSEVKCFHQLFSRPCMVGIIGFCGNIYPWAYAYDRYTFSYEDAYQALPQKDKSSRYYNKESSARYIKNIFDFDFSSFKTIFQEYKTPIFCMRYSSNYEDKYYDKYKMVLNPILKDFEFYKVIDTYQAYQQIYMYMSGVLGPQPKTIPPINDDIKIELHGFNKQSFRTQPKTKPNRKRK